MTIHFRILQDDCPTEKIYRSLKSAQKDRPNGAKIVAFATRKHAATMAKDRISIGKNTKEMPEILTANRLSAFIDKHETARNLYYRTQGRYSAYVRRQIERENAQRLWGFGPEGQTVIAQQNMSVSAQYVRYSCPILISGKKSTITALKGFADRAAQQETAQ